MADSTALGAAELSAAAIGFAVGFSLAAPPGPVNALIARESAQHGAWAGIRAGIAAPILDTVYLCLALLGAATFDLEPFTPHLATVGAGLMAYLAVQIARPRPARQLAGPWAVILVTLTNPFQYAWWVAWGTTQAASLGVLGIAGFLSAIFGWVFVFSFLVRAGATRWEWFEPLVGIVSADVLFWFALALLVDGAQSVPGL